MKRGSRVDINIIKWILDRVTEEEVLDITRKTKVQVNGFRRIQLTNGKLNLPRNLIIKEIINKKYINVLEKYLKENYNDEKLKCRDINKIFNDYSINDTIKILINLDTSIAQEDRELAQEIFKKVKTKQFSNNMSYEKENNNFNILKVEIEKLKREIEILKNKSNVLEDINNKITIEKKRYKRQIDELENKNKKAIDELNENNKEKEKIKSDFYSLKKKYDILNDENKTFKNKIKEKNDECELLKYNNKILKNELNIIKENEKKEIKTVAIFGEIYPKEINNMENYNILKVDINKIDDNNMIEKINNCDEIWILSYDTSILDMQKIERIITNNKIKVFKSFKVIKQYIKDMRCSK